MKHANILIAHGGGPTPVMNSSLRGVIEGSREGSTSGKLYAARFGAEGILKNDLIDLSNISSDQVERLSVTPASAIGSCRRKLSDADYPTILETLKKNDINCLLYNGGNDSMDSCYKLSLLTEKSGMDLNVIGVPKTIDNDLAETDHSPGYGSAARFAAMCAAEIGADASALPIHIVVLEIMGRNAGWLTAAAGLGQRISHCDMMVLLPEKLLDKEAFLKEAELRFKKGHGLLVAVSEGICGLDGKPVADSGIVDGFGHKVPGGAAQSISDMIMKDLGIKSRSEKPGLLGRCSMNYVSETDRAEAYMVGKEAVLSALRGETGTMVALSASRRNGYRCSLKKVDLKLVANTEKKFPPEWIDGWGISSDFNDYALPLIGGDLPKYTHLR